MNSICPEAQGGQAVNAAAAADVQKCFTCQIANFLGKTFRCEIDLRLLNLREKISPVFAERESRISRCFNRCINRAHYCIPPETNGKRWILETRNPAPNAPDLLPNKTPIKQR